MSSPDDPAQGAEAWLEPGTALGRYTLGRRLGRGGMGEVYEGVHSALKRRVAVKVLRPEVAQNPRVRARFEREGVAVARVEHPHVVDVFDVGVEQGVAFMVMEFLEGEDLGALLRRAVRLPVERSLELMLPVLAAVAAGHEVGVIHRDLKPSNVFVSRTRQGVEVPKVLDFGIARIADGDHNFEVTRNSAILGTPHYIAPEMTRGAKHADARSDQYSLAVILHQCVAGERPFEGETLYETIHAIVHGQAQPLDALRAGVPRGFAAVVSRALSKRPDERFSNVIELGRALVPFAGSRVRAQWAPVFGEAAGDDNEPTTMALPAGFDPAYARRAVDGPTPTPSVDMSPVARTVSVAPRPPRDAASTRARLILWGSAALAVLSVGTSVALVSRSRPAAVRPAAVVVATGQPAPTQPAPVAQTAAPTTPAAPLPEALPPTGPVQQVLPAESPAQRVVVAPAPRPARASRDAGSRANPGGRAHRQVPRPARPTGVPPNGAPILR